MDLKMRRLRMSEIGNHKLQQGEQEPVSPGSQSVESDAISLCIHVVAEIDRLVDVLHANQAIKDMFLQKNPRFSSIMRKDRHGVIWWEKTKVNVEDHIFVPEFPAGLAEYDELVNEYISNVELRQLPRCRPLWEFHFINYRTCNAEATVILKFNHAMGDGASLMSLAFECFTPLSSATGIGIGISPAYHLPSPSTPFHSSQKPSSEKKLGLASLQKWFHRFCVFVITMWYTVMDLICILQRLKWDEDSKLPMRGHPGVELLPRHFSSATLQMEDVLQIKNCVGGTVNDVIMGVVFSGLQRYLRFTLFKGGEICSYPNKESDKKMEDIRLTSLVLINSRPRSGPKKLQEMLKSNSKTPWGNRFGFLHVPIPMRKAEDPLDHVRRAKEIMDKKKMSLATILMSRVINFITRFKGSEATGKAMYNTLAHTTLAVTNLVGPTEKVMVAGYPVKSLFFSVSGVPQTVLVTSISYMGSLRLQVMTTKGYANADLLASCFAECFQEMKVFSL